MNLKKLFEKNYLGYDEYKERINFLDKFYFQQHCRKSFLRCN